ncbi:hypothetical protein CANMA_001319 [Candida margitis]|uniref:uncharacterized protein n=1 Tax=Candida margitis TaxID=1775924 RepID=UPI002227D5DA|nr:uncharacterized protein CANMA_001319 [Candida margitis]KAI5969656.1 hypothetical protein CANMA_001319 [Candida margitis]
MYKYTDDFPVVLESTGKNIRRLEDPVLSEPKRLKLQQPETTTMSHQQQSKPSGITSSFPSTHSSSANSTTMHHDSLRGTFTPLTTTNSFDGKNNYFAAVSMINEKHFVKDQQQSEQLTIVSTYDCPCGHMHGPGQGHHEDIGAVGFADFPLLRGPD